MPARSVALVLLALGVAGGCGVSDGAVPARPHDPARGLRGVDLGLGFDQVVVPGDLVPGAVNDGTAPVDITVVTQGGGRLTWTPGRGGGAAVRTPAYAAEGPVPAAAIVVRTDPTVPDPLDPGTRDLVVGVDFRADPATAGRPGDDGDNLVQRGRFGDATQLKIQLDHGVPSCRLAGTLGEIVVAGDQPVTPDRWYRLTCTRSAGAVHLRLLDLEDPAAPQEWTAAGDPGEIAFAHVPLSIGAKVTARGGIAGDSADQFHGTIDRVVVDVR
ncbi:hypothetical protein RB608_26495 [Nocardioides sp. LHD-245]|uniref:hypothetical protein n=1 Tax=Nocardioides sp. LHD-245 TaxID=3051387 RepID=UPI0027DFBF79|nr:hypothetical protein [Nocardioides sp. LHD-245]